MKLCSTCKEIKSFESFYNDACRKDGRYPNCIECHKEYIRKRTTEPLLRAKRLAKMKELRETSSEFRDKANQRSRDFYASLEGRARSLHNNARKSPTGMTQAFTLTLDHIVNLLKIGHCPMTGVKFDFGPNKNRTGKSGLNPAAPSIDRINSLFGYTNENTRIVIWQYNLMKGELTDNQVLELCKLVINWSNCYVIA